VLFWTIGEPFLSDARRRLGETAFNQAVAEGRTMTLERAVADALGNQRA
jgi:hypothetical protein